MKKRTTKKRGRPKVELPKKSIEEMAARGCTVEEIAGILGVHRNTITANFSAEVALGRNRLADQLRGKQVDLAMKGSVPLLIWLGKQYLGQRDKTDAVVREEVITIQELPPKVQHEA